LYLREKGVNEILQLPEIDLTMIIEKHIKLRKMSKKIIEDKLL